MNWKTARIPDGLRGRHIGGRSRGRVFSIGVKSRKRSRRAASPQVGFFSSRDVAQAIRVGGAPSIAEPPGHFLELVREGGELSFSIAAGSSEGLGATTVKLDVTFLPPRGTIWCLTQSELGEEDLPPSGIRRSQSLREGGRISIA